MVSAGKSRTMLLHYSLCLMLLFFYMFFSVSHSDTISLGQSLSEDQTTISGGKFELSPDTITSTEFIKDPHTLVSKGGIFKLGFFSPVNTTNRYLGVLYNTPATTTAVWVANRKNPLKDSNGSLTISKDGNLLILDGEKQIIWSSNVSSSVANSSAQLSDTGNLVLRDNSNGRTIWESFEHPSDSFLPKMRVTDRESKDTKILLNSWRSPSDPSVGDFLAGVDSVHVPQIFVWNGSRPYWRSGPWNGRTFLGVPYMDSVDVNEFTLVDDRYNAGTVYFAFTYAIGPSATYFWLNSEGSLIQRYWIESRKDWEVTWSAVINECDVYGKCGPYGSCDSKALPICSCLRGFVPKVLEEWNRGNWTSGCVRRKQLLCERNSTSGEEGKVDGFLRLRTMKVPDFALQNNAPKGNCGSHCLDTCSCIATAYDPTIGCIQWYDSLIDVQKFSGGGGVDLYIRVANSELGSRNKKLLYMATAISIALVLVIVGPVLCFLCLRRRKHKRTVTHGKNQDLLLLNLDNSSKANTHSIDKSGEDKKVLELPMFSFSSISAATNNFLAANKLGEGGFGPVYKGSLVNGQLVAVKRLSKMSGQGLEELRNEAILIAKVQHRNLVRLLGCCTEKDEKILMYEYMPNKSLDSFLFDPNKRELLNWSRRVRIIEGIAQGFLYLHEHSRLRIVHRDLKASNILLDGDMNPKISDFGMARIFGGNQLQANTNRIVGTYGYMSPEYAMEGRFSVKSDVFAFGVLLLEILSGKKNTGFQHLDYLSLLVYAWELWENERALELIDQILQIPSSSSMPLRYILVGLLCIQDNPDDRPTISDVLAMLSNEHTTLASPNDLHLQLGELSCLQAQIVAKPKTVQ